MQCPFSSSSILYFPTQTTALLHPGLPHAIPGSAPSTLPLRPCQELFPTRRAAQLCPRSSLVIHRLQGVHPCTEGSGDQTLTSSPSCRLLSQYLMATASDCTSHSPRSCHGKSFAWRDMHTHKEKGKDQAKAKVVSLSFFNIQFPQNVGNIPLHFQGHLKYIFVIDWLYYMSSWQTKKRGSWENACLENWMQY